LKFIQLILLIFISVTIAVSQTAEKFNLTIIPMDDGSERRIEYKSLYNNTSYYLMYGMYNDSSKLFVGEYKDSIVFISDTTKLIVKDGTLYIKNATGKTNLFVLNARDKNILFKGSFELINKPSLTIQVDKFLLKNKKTLKIQLINDKGVDCSTEFYGLCNYKFINKDGDIIWSVSDDKFIIKNVFENIEYIEEIFIYVKLINKKNGLWTGPIQELRTTLN